MRQKLLISFVAVIVAMMVLVAGAGAQPVSLQDQLAAQYKLAKMGSDTSGYSVVEEGTPLAIQKGGILAVPYSDSSDFKSKYQDGAIKSPGGLAVVGRKSIMGRFGKEQTTHLFAKGDKVYPTKIDVNVSKDSVTLGIVACDTCNKTDPPTYNKAEVVFEFPKGSLANATADSVQKVIAQVFTISKDDSKDDKGEQRADDMGGQTPVAENELPKTDRLGTTWNVWTAGSTGIWKRRTTSNIFDANWENGEVTAVLTISLEGTVVRVARRNSSDGNDCDYQGTVAPDGMTVSGTFNCMRWVHNGPWRATIQSVTPIPRPNPDEQSAIGPTSFRVGFQPTGMAFDGANIWVANNSGNTVTEIQPSNGNVLGTFPTGPYPTGVAFDGVNIWIACNGAGSGNTMTVLSAATGQQLPFSPVPTGGYNPREVVFDGQNIWVANSASNSVSKVHAGNGPGSGTLLGTFTVGAGPDGLAFDGSNVWVSNRDANSVTKLQASTGKVLGTYTVGTGPFGIAFDGSHIWVAVSGTRLTELALNGSVLKTLVVANGASGVSFDGVYIWVASQNSHTVTKILASNGTVVGTFAVFGNPWGVVFDGANIWVSNFTGSNVWKFSSNPTERAQTTWLGFANGNVVQDRDIELRRNCGDFKRVYVPDNAGNNFNDLCGYVSKTCERVCDWEGRSISCDAVSLGGNRDGTRVALCRSSASVEVRQVTNDLRVAVPPRVANPRSKDNAPASPAATFAVGSHPYGMAFDGSNIWVVNNFGNTVTKLRVSDVKNMGTFAVGSRPGGAAFDGANIWVVNSQSSSVTKLRASDGTVLSTTSGVDCVPTWAVFDGANIWVSNSQCSKVTKIRASDGTVLAKFAVGDQPEGLAFDGANIWVANTRSNSVTKLRAIDGTVLGTFPVGTFPEQVAFDGTNMWVTNDMSGTVTKLLASNGEELGTFRVGTGPVGIAFDGVNIWVANNNRGVGNGSVTELNANGEVLGTFTVGRVPNGVAFDGAYIWVTNEFSDSVSKLRAAP